MTGAVSVQDRFDVTVLSPGAGRGCGADRLPGPLHMGGTLARYSLLSPAERLRVTRAALAMRFVDPARPEADRERLGDWLAAHGQGERARRRLWDLFTVSALNIGGDDASLALAATVVRTALLGARDAADIGVPAVPLGDLHGEAGGRLLARLGATVRLGAKVAAVRPLPGGGFGVELADRGAPGWRRGPAGVGVVLAVPPGPAARLLPAGAALGPGGWNGLGASPIVNVHVIYDRRVTRLPFAAAVDSPVSGFSTGPARRAGRRPVPGRLALGRRRLGGHSRRGAAGAVSCPRCRSSSRRPARRGSLTSSSPGNAGPPSGRCRAAARAARARTGIAGPGARRRMDRYRLAGHDGGSRAKRTDAARELRRRWQGGRQHRAAGPGRRRGRSVVMTAVMPAGVETARDLVGPAIAAAVNRLSPEVRMVAAYHLGLDGRGAGKALRPALALLSARAAGAAPERGVPAAVAVELVHNFSLIHDDIMDGDTERRHRPTAWTVFGVGAAILAGDALLALAQDILLEDTAPQGLWAARCLSAAVHRLIAGQGADSPSSGVTT